MGTSLERVYLSDELLKGINSVLVSTVASWTDCHSRTILSMVIYFTISRFHIPSGTPILSSDFRGAYNKLLYTLFLPDTDFTVVPEYLKPASSKSSDYTVTFEIFLENKPGFHPGAEEACQSQFNFAPGS